MSADLAFFVVDEWQGRGVGTMLLRALLPRAEANGITSLVALTLHDNAPAARSCAPMGFRKVGASHGVAELRLALRGPIAQAACRARGLRPPPARPPGVRATTRGCADLFARLERRAAPLVACTIA